VGITSVSSLSGRLIPTRSWNSSTVVSSFPQRRHCRMRLTMCSPRGRESVTRRAPWQLRHCMLGRYSDFDDLLAKTTHWCGATFHRIDSGERPKRDGFQRDTPTGNELTRLDRLPELPGKPRCHRGPLIHADCACWSMKSSRTMISASSFDRFIVPRFRRHTGDNHS
jgi:hypothetical protein